MRPADLARETNLPTPTVHRLVTGKSTRPYKSSLEPIADYFSLSVDQLLGESPLPAEYAVGDDSKKAVLHNNVAFIPLIEWGSLDTFRDSDVELERNIPYIGNISEAGFAIIMPDSSMEPQFSRDNVLILDPDVEPTDRSFVLVRLADGTYVLRQLLIDGNHRFLKPLNPDLSVFKMRLLDDGDLIKAVLVEARQLFGVGNLLK